MRKLYLVPIIHMSADMGSLASVLEERATAELGLERWRRHQEIVAGFWDAIAQFFDSLEASDFKIYQDGLVADGAEGRRIIEEGIRRGSQNYEIIGQLLDRGAILVKTEDIVLVQQERNQIIEMTRFKSVREMARAAPRYKLVQNTLLRQRDEYIARRIKVTLQEGETGILFIGAEHDLLSQLPGDIQVSQIKGVAKVKEYHRALAGGKGQSRRFHQLAAYLTSPVVL